MLKDAVFDFHFHHLTYARFHRGGAGVKDWVTPARSLSVRITRMRCSMLLESVLDSVLMRVVSKVITVTVGVADLAARRDSVAA